MTLTVTVGNDSVVHMFVVVKEFLYPVVLGSDFLSQADAVLHYGKRTVLLHLERMLLFAYQFEVC